MIQRTQNPRFLPLRSTENTISILVVDDTEAIVQLLSHFLGRMADQIEIARDGKEAVALVTEACKNNDCYDVVLMDLQMPKMSGLEAARLIREQGIDVPLIAMTAGGFGSAECTAAGFDGYVSKPFDRREFVEYVAKFLG